MPWPEFGPVYRGWDWGGNNPHAIVWCQKLNVQVGLAWQEVVPEKEGYPPRFVLTPIMGDGDEREAVYVIPAGALVQFDEIHGDAATIGEFSSLGLRAVMREIQWTRLGVAVRPSGDFCDPAGYIAKREVKKAINGLIDHIGQGQLQREEEELMAACGLTFEDLEGYDIQVPDFTSRPAPRYESIRKHVELGEDGMLYYVPEMCPATDDEYTAYHWLEPKPGKNIPEDAAKEDDHCMDAERYLIWNVERASDQAPTEAPSADKAKPEPAPSSQFAPPQTVTRRGEVPGGEVPAVAQPGTGIVGVDRRGTGYGGRSSTERWGA